MRLPNGFGSVHKLPGKRRRPWRARVTAGWISVDQDGNEVPEGSVLAVDAKQKYYTIGYYATRKEALAALSAFQGIPDETVPTFAEMYVRWLETKSLSAGSLKKYKSLRQRLAPLDDHPADQLTVEGLDSFFKSLDCPDSMRHGSAMLCQQVLKYAYKKGWLASDLAARMDHYAQPKAQIQRKVFTPEEVAALWRSSSRYAAPALIGLYGGWRPEEVLTLTPGQIDLQDGTITAGVKTEAGKGRVVPIHSAILPLVTELCRDAGPVLFPFSYNAYHGFIKKLGHLPHDTRHTFATVAKDAGMDPTIRKKLLGHAVTDITESVYTHATADRFRAEIEKIKY